MGWWQSLADELRRCVELFLPPACLLCGERLPPGADPALFCPACCEELLPPAPGRCPRCATPSPSRSAIPHLCLDCLDNPPPFDRVSAVGPYTGTLQRAIRRFKHHGQLPLELPLGRLLAEAAARGGGGVCPDLLVPVPLHIGRLRHRGYNQALQLARQVGSRLDLPVDPLLLRRQRATTSQQGLDADARSRNLMNAFTVTRPLRGEHILLIDDVMTTGTTTRECASALKTAGAAVVEVAVLARA